MKMLPKIVSGTIGMATVIALAASTAHANLLVDPSFETEGAAGAFAQSNPIPVPSGVAGGWASFGGTLTTAAANSGIYSAQLADNGWNPSGVYQLVSASPGQTFDLSASYMSSNPSVAGYATPALVQISFFDSAGATNGLSGPLPFSAGDWQPLGAANTWVQSPTVTATAPAGTAMVGVYLMMMDNSGANGLNFYYDDANLTLVPEPATIALLGLGLAFPLYLIRRRR